MSVDDLIAANDKVPFLVTNCRSKCIKVNMRLHVAKHLVKDIPQINTCGYCGFLKKSANRWRFRLIGRIQRIRTISLARWTIVRSESLTAVRDYANHLHNDSYHHWSGFKHGHGQHSSAYTGWNGELLQLKSSKAHTWCKISVGENRSEPDLPDATSRGHVLVRVHVTSSHSTQRHRLLSSQNESDSHGNSLSFSYDVNRSIWLVKCADQSRFSDEHRLRRYHLLHDGVLWQRPLWYLHVSRLG